MVRRQFNTIYYNPKVTYLPAINSDGTSMSVYGSPWTSVRIDGFDSGAGTINLVSGYREIVYCQNSNDNRTSSSNCRRNGIDTANPFLYNTASASNGYPNGTGSGDFRFRHTSGNPYYYDIEPRRVLRDPLLRLHLSATPTGNYRVSGAAALLPKRQ